MTNVVGVEEMVQAGGKPTDQLKPQVGGSSPPGRIHYWHGRKWRGTTTVTPAKNSVRGRAGGARLERRNPRTHITDSEISMTDRTPRRASFISLAGAFIVLACSAPASAQPREVQLSQLTGANGFTIRAEAIPDAQAGRTAKRIGDINADGIDDIAISAPFADFDKQLSVGRVYIIFGQKHTEDLVNLELGSLNGVNGFVIIGRGVDLKAGFSIDGLGDFNGDGFDDLLIGAPEAAPLPRSPGEAYIIFGRPEIGAGGVFHIADVNGLNGLRLGGDDFGEAFGFVVVGLGDINGDGLTDAAITSPGKQDVNGLPGVGQVLIIYGKQIAESVAAPRGGLDGFAIQGENAFDNLGFSAACAGDVNQDGVADLILGASGAGPNGSPLSGRAYIVSGLISPNDTVISIDSLTEKEEVFTFDGVGVGHRFGASVGSAGDVNADGYVDVVVGAPTATPAGARSGQAYVLFGGAGGPPSAGSNLADLTGETGFVVNGATGDQTIDAGDLIGFTVGPAGDVNGDGIDDLALGSPTANVIEGVINSGQTIILYGWPRIGAGGVVRINEIEKKEGLLAKGFGINTLSGRSVSPLGDMNGDGADDLIIGSVGADLPNARNAGEVYVVFGIRELLADATCDGRVNHHDLATLLGLWGSAARQGDMNADGTVNSTDLTFLLGSWGTTHE